jgi:YVTN family beta-propeller protein
MSNLNPGEGGIVEFYVRVTETLPAGVEWITNTVEIGGNEEECNTANNISTEETPVTGTITTPFTIFMPMIARSSPPQIIDTIPIGVHPKSLVISEDHNRVYVTLFDDDGSGNPGGNGRLVVLNLATREVVAKVPTGGIHPMGITILGDQLYVVNNGSDEVAVMDANSLAVLRTIPVGHSPFGVAATGNRVYATNFDDGTLSIIDAATDTVINTVLVGRHPAFPAAWGNCAYVANHSGREGVTVVCDDGAEIHRLREEWGYFAATVDPMHNLAYFSRRDGLPGLYEISATPPYGPDKPVRKKAMLSTPPFAIHYNPATNHILVVAAANDQLHIIWPSGYHTGNVWSLPQQNEGPEWHGGQGLDATDHDVWVANYADGSVSVLYDPP